MRKIQIECAKWVWPFVDFINLFKEKSSDTGKYSNVKWINNWILSLLNNLYMTKKMLFKILK